VNGFVLLIRTQPSKTLSEFPSFSAVRQQVLLVEMARASTFAARPARS